MIWQGSSVSNRPQVGEFKHQQLYSAAFEVNPGLGALAASFAPAYYAPTEGLMDDVSADRYSVGALRVDIFSDLAGAVVHVSAARRRAQRGARSEERRVGKE